MSCERASTAVHGYLDGELDAVRAAEFEKHLEECPECVAELERQEALRSSLQRAQLYERAPEALRRKLRVVRDDEEASIETYRQWFHRYRGVRSVRLWLAAAAAIVMGFVAGWYVMHNSGAASGAVQALSAQVLDAHLRALQPGHLTDVVSTDQHTVKPWFDGKLDFAPPVRDLAENGFPLQGGRLDVVNGQSVAALVYGHRQHVVNVFVWPSAEPDSAPVAAERLGYHWIEWHKDGMELWAVSDLNAQELAELQRLLM